MSSKLILRFDQNITVLACKRCQGIAFAHVYIEPLASAEDLGAVKALKLLDVCMRSKQMAIDGVFVREKLQANSASVIF